MIARVVTLALASLLMLSANSAIRAQGVITTVEDFEGELPGPQAYPGGYSFAGGGIPPGFEDVLPPVRTEEVVAGGVGGGQAYQVTIDSSANAGGYFYYGFGGFHGFFGENFGFAQGQPGEDNPANFTMSFDLKVAGAVNPVPVRGAIVIYKPDYELVNGVDLNNDGDMEDGFDIWTSNFAVPVAGNNYADFNNVVWNLSQGSSPTAPAPINTAQFDDEATFGFQIFFNNDEFGNDAGNVITVDNMALTFTPQVGGAGDFDGDGDADGDDFLAWQRGESPNPFSETDLADWEGAYGTGGAAAVAGAIPEPSSMALAVVALAALSRARLRRAG